MLLEREPLNTFMAVSFFNENIKNNVNSNNNINNNDNNNNNNNDNNT